MVNKILKYGVVLTFLIVCGIISYSTVNTGKSDSLEIQKAKEIQELRSIRFWGSFWRWSAIIVGSVVLIGGIISLVVYWRVRYLHASRCLAKVDHSEIPIAHKQLQAMTPMIAGLITVKGVEAHNTQEAVAMYKQCFRDLLAFKRKGTEGSSQSDVFSQKNPAMLPSIVPSVPSLHDLLVDKVIAPGTPLIFGYTQAGHPYTGSWSDAYSMGVIGESGSGKTSTACFYLAESLLTGEIGSCVILDRHYPHEESFLARLGNLKDFPHVHYFDFLENFGSVKKKLQEYLQDLLIQELDRRLQSPDYGKKPLVFITDETLQLCDLFSFLPAIILRIATAGRKAQVYEMCLSHSWKHGIVGGTEVRDNLVSKVAHKTTKKSAHLLLQNSEQSNIVPTLKTGQTFFVPSQGEAQILTIPKIETSDMNEIARLLQSLQPRVQGGTDATTSSRLTPERCKQLRTEQDLTLRTLAQKAGLNTRSGFVDLSKYENGEKDLSEEEKHKISRVLGLYQTHEKAGTA